MKLKYIFLPAAVLAVAVSILTGCAEKQENSDGIPTLTYWCPFYANYTGVFNSLNDTPFYKGLEERTGVRLNFIHPPADQVEEGFDLMISSGDLPDLIEHSFLGETIGYKGGPSRAMQDNIIIDVTDLINTKAPNLKKVLEEHPDWDRLVKTDEGRYYCFPALRGDASLAFWTGLQMRSDYLQKVNMEAPETIDEWETVLTAFRDQLGLPYPLTFPNASFSPVNHFVGAFGVTVDFYLEGDTVKYGPLEPGYLDFLKLFQRWMEQGLLDPDFATHDIKVFDAKIASGEAGAYQNSVGGGMGKYLVTTKKNNPEADITAVKFPVLQKGDKVKFGYYTCDYTPHQSVSITTACKDLDVAARFLDYGYSQEGKMYYNFGEEGVSYNMVNGYPTYTEEVTNNPDGLDMNQGIVKYSRANLLGPMIQDGRYFEQYMVNPQQKEAPEIWKLDDTSWCVPPITLTEEESKIVASRLTEITKYVREMEIKFIMGVEPFSNYDAFCSRIRNMGIDEVLAAQQAALVRFNNR